MWYFDTFNNRITQTQEFHRQGRQLLSVFTTIITAPFPSRKQSM